MPNFNQMSFTDLIIYCYDHRPDLYARLTAQRTRAEVLAWLTPPPPPAKNTAVDFGEQNKFKGAKIKRVRGGSKTKGTTTPSRATSSRVTFGKRNDFSGAEIEDITGGDEVN
jgi:hypothetical protein